MDSTCGESEPLIPTPRLQLLCALHLLDTNPTFPDSLPQQHSARQRFGVGLQLLFQIVIMPHHRRRTTHVIDHGHVVIVRGGLEAATFLLVFLISTFLYRKW